MGVARHDRMSSRRNDYQWWHASWNSGTRCCIRRLCNFVTFDDLGNCGFDKSWVLRHLRIHHGFWNQHLSHIGNLLAITSQQRVGNNKHNSYSGKDISLRELRRCDMGNVVSMELSQGDIQKSSGDNYFMTIANPVYAYRLTTLKTITSQPDKSLVQKCIDKLFFFLSRSTLFNYYNSAKEQSNTTANIPNPIL